MKCHTDLDSDKSSEQVSSPISHEQSGTSGTNQTKQLKEVKSPRRKSKCNSL